MADIKLYHLPGACSRVTMIALEHVGADYEDVLVALMKGEQNTPEYRAINPKGKIPALVVDGKLLTENAAILWWLNQEFPEAALMPKASDAWTRAKQLSDLFWISAGWHPSVRANMMPVRFTTGDPEPVKARGKELVKPIFDQFDALLQKQPWWFGDQWSILDAYAYWCYTTAEEGDYDLSGLDALADHRKRLSEHPAFQSTIARENAAFERMG